MPRLTIDSAAPSPTAAPPAAYARRAAAVVAAALALWAFAPFVLIALDAARRHLVFTGVAGYFPWDGLQYLAFVRDGHGVLIRNLFGLTGGAVFAHPIWSLTGVVQGVTGAGPVTVMAFWKAVSVVVLLAGAARLAARHLPPARRAPALALCLFGGFTPIVLLWGTGNTEVRGAAIDLIPAATLWDYAPIAIAIGLMPFAVEGFERILAGTATRRGAWGTAACCLIVGWLHPWQAGTLLLMWLGLLAWHARERAARTSLRRARGRVALVLAATAAAPLYYASLSHFDYSWAQFSRTDGRDLLITWPALLYCVAPLVAVALVAARAGLRRGVPASLLMWPLATLAVVALSPPEQYHALDGIMLGLGVLVARVWGGGRLARLAAVGGLAAMAATFALFAAASLRDVQSPTVRRYAELAPSDVRAVALAARADGGRPILTTPALGSAIPMLADAPTWVGNLFWTPDSGERSSSASLLFAGIVTGSTARAFVLSTGARAVIEPCGYSAPLAAELAPAGFRGRAVGCARLYVRRA